MRLDCLIIGYNDTPFSRHLDLVGRKGGQAIEYRTARHDHVRFDGQRLPYMDLLSELDRRRSGAGAGHVGYHIGEVPNLAAVYLTSHLRRHGYEADFVSAFRPEQDRLAALLTERDPVLTVITTTFYVSPGPVIELVEFVRERNPETMVVVGGPLVANLIVDADAATLPWVLAEIGADVYVHDGQGEDTLRRLTAAVRDGRPLEDVPNLLWVRDGETVVSTRRVPENNSLDECAIEWGQFDGADLGPVLQTRTARSCAFKCGFCDYPIRAGALSLASLETIERELDAMAELGATDVVFIDDTFNVPLPRFVDICQLMIRKGYGFRWYSYFRCGNVRGSDMFDLMARSGCAGVFLGIESGDDTVLKAMSKSASVDRYRNGIERLNERGIMSFASFIAGFPGETERTVQHTIDFLNDVAPTFFRIEPWWYNHRAPIHQQAAKYALTGRDFRWRHATMDSAGACDAVDRVFAEVTESLWMPMWNFDFWALPYLLGRGFSPEQVVRLHRLGRDLMVLNDGEDAGTAARRRVAERALVDWYAGVDSRPSRYGSAAGSPTLR
ncbi:PhpK family radical SAM P-methyltransferase [Micromonospora sp. DSM 115977]|uniref:PhpK family radical SAM P-methyltransferase n=1 Tax=Micromonospora reichwaldensis TaxID=3075516 RepID=A0ABU2WTF9_9ACTN|nr:PhpK family radical SAM P-methyltransferase [Micromonospora sp. DSM 115977]MDT0529146.1 PhpK family radical SAM P-methyltransferase [Micromonospora sp. DSM 115977]